VNIQFDDEQMMMCQEAWNELDPEERIQMSHYDLAKNTYIDSTEIWMEFMSEPAVQEQLSRELLLYKEAQQRKLIAKANVNDKSMGTARSFSAFLFLFNNCFYYFFICVMSTFFIMSISPSII